MIYRALTHEDITAVSQLFKKLQLEGAEVSFVETIAEEEIEKWLNAEGTFVYIARDDLQVYGVLRGRRENSNPKAVILTVAIDPDSRGQAYAKALTLYGLTDMADHEVDLARAYIYSDNYASVRTILSLGFTMGGSVYKHHYNEKKGRYVDDLIFHKLLRL